MHICAYVNGMVPIFYRKNNILYVLKYLPNSNSHRIDIYSID